MFNSFQKSSSKAYVKWGLQKQRYKLKKNPVVTSEKLILYVLICNWDHLKPIKARKFRVKDRGSTLTHPAMLKNCCKLVESSPAVRPLQYLGIMN